MNRQPTGPCQIHQDNARQIPRAARWSCPGLSPLFALNAAYSASVPWRKDSKPCRSARPDDSGSTGLLRSSVWIVVFSSTQHTAACSCGFRYRSIYNGGHCHAACHEEFVPRLRPYRSTMLRLCLSMTSRKRSLAIATQVLAPGTAFMESEMRLRGISTSNTVTLTCWLT